MPAGGPWQSDACANEVSWLSVTGEARRGEGRRGGCEIVSDSPGSLSSAARPVPITDMS